ncbi:BTB/POZ domain-containing protein-like protein, partial [Tanacetum coccineum]
MNRFPIKKNSNMGYQKYSSLSNNNYRKNGGVGEVMKVQRVLVLLVDQEGATQVGSIAAGGCYDNLIGMFGTKSVVGIGVGLGIERVFTIIEDAVEVSDNENVGKLMESFLARITFDRNLLVSKFINFVECLPLEVRVIEDGMHRAIDIYLK